MVLLSSAATLPSAVHFFFVPLSLSPDIVNILSPSLVAVVSLLRLIARGEMSAGGFHPYTLVWSAG